MQAQREEEDAGRPWTVQEYFAAARASVEKLEYMDGDVFAMSGSTIAHAQLTANVIAALGQHLRGSPCRPFSPDLRIATSPTRYFYPDVAVVCGPIEVSPLDKDSVTNPKVIFEVLSPSTTGFDRGKKFEAYGELISLQEVVFVLPYERHLEHYRRIDNNQWHLTRVRDDEVLVLPALDARISLAEIYDDVTLDRQPQARRGRVVLRIEDDDDVTE